MNYNPYYGNNMMGQANPYANQYFTSNMQNQRMQPTEQFGQPQPMYKQSLGLQGKSVDSIEVVKAMDIPLDGTVSYFPIVDGSAIVTKQLQPDGTSKTIIYKPVELEEPTPQPKYVTVDELEERFKKVTTIDYREDIKSLKRQIKDLTDDLKDIASEIEKRRDD